VIDQVEDQQEDDPMTYYSLLVRLYTAEAVQLALNIRKKNL